MKESKVMPSWIKAHTEKKTVSVQESAVTDNDIFKDRSALKQLNTTWGVEALEYFFLGDNKKDSANVFKRGFYNTRNMFDRKSAEDAELEINKFLFDDESAIVGALRSGDIEYLQNICNEVDGIVAKYSQDNKSETSVQESANYRSDINVTDKSFAITLQQPQWVRGGYKAYKVYDPRVFHKFSRGTKWCNQDRVIAEYLKKGPYFVVYNQDGKPYAAIHPATYTYVDVEDQQLEPGVVSMLKKTFPKMFMNKEKAAAALSSPVKVNDEFKLYKLEHAEDMRPLARGSRWGYDPIHIQRYMDRAPFYVVYRDNKPYAAINDDLWYTANDENMSPEQIDEIKQAFPEYF